VPLSKLKDSFNDGTSIAYIEELEQRYKADPSSVDKTWGMFFKAMGESLHCRLVLGLDCVGGYVARIRFGGG
jgi:2-oxoglutarate dehydrogenase complex dehydrogenase (E1) component-like enzyme